MMSSAGAPTKPFSSAEENVLKQKAEGSTALLQIHSRCLKELITNPITLRQLAEQTPATRVWYRSLRC